MSILFYDHLLPIIGYYVTCTQLYDVYKPDLFFICYGVCICFRHTRNSLKLFRAPNIQIINKELYWNPFSGIFGAFNFISNMIVYLTVYNNEKLVSSVKVCTGDVSWRSFPFHFVYSMSTGYQSNNDVASIRPSRFMAEIPPCFIALILLKSFIFQQKGFIFTADCLCKVCL